VEKNSDLRPSSSEVVFTSFGDQRSCTAKQVRHIQGIFCLSGSTDTNTGDLSELCHDAAFSSVSQARFGEAAAEPSQSHISDTAAAAKAGKTAAV